MKRRRTSIAGKLTAFLLGGFPLLVVCGLSAGFIGAFLGAYLSFSADLPKIPDLRAYRPKTVSTFYAEDGTVVGIFYREKRFPVPVEAIPPHVVNAFLAAEDARFFSHRGVDWFGVLRAAVKNIEAGSFAQGGSTITQQVTRNFLLTRQKKISRKIREAILSYRLERTLSKKEILGIYLNEVYLGNGAYGVESAARTYFGKTCRDLTPAEAAMLGGLVASPSKYSPTRNLKAALERRSVVLASMLRNGFISRKEYRRAADETPSFRENLPNPYKKAPYFTEAVRQYIVEKYGEDRLYNDGLTVWTTCDLSLQKTAADALLKGTTAWEKRQRRPRGLVRRLNTGELRNFLNNTPKDPYKLGSLIQAVVVKNHTPGKRKRKRQKGEEDGCLQECTLALQGNSRFRMGLESEIRFRPNDLLEFSVTAVEGNRLTLAHQPVPPVQGAVVCVENRTGYVRTLVGGLDFERSRFNRAIQALRQPGSAFKPFVYTAALEWSDYSPLTVIVDEPIAVVVDPREEEWVPMNSDGQFLGPINLRQGLAFSRNAATVKLLMDVGIDSAIAMARNMGIRSPLGRNISLCLGVSEVTPLELTAAYSVFPNMGIKVHPVLVKKVVDRFGNVLEDNTVDPIEITPETLSSDHAMAWLRQKAHDRQRYQDRQFFRGDGDRFLEEDRRGSFEEIRRRATPEEDSSLGPVLEALLSMRGRLPSRMVFRRPEPTRVISPQTAYLMLSILRETCVSGTAAKASRLGRKDLAGKTGTTDDSTDAWFIGFNPKYTTGVWVGYDTKVSLGRKEYGSRAALPIWMNFMGSLLANEPSEGYPPPPGIAFWGLEGGAMPRRSDTAALLEAGPVLGPEFAAKQVSPIDMSVEPVAGYVDPGFGSPGPGYPETDMRTQDMGMYDESVYRAASGSFYPGMVRVLSPRGETLGHAPYSFDEKGNTIVQRDAGRPDYRLQEQIPGDDRASADRAEHPSQSFLPRAGRFILNLQRFIPKFEWVP